MPAVTVAGARSIRWFHSSCTNGSSPAMIAAFSQDVVAPKTVRSGAAGLVDRLQVTVFPVVSGRTGTSPVLAGAEDFDMHLLDSRTLDGRTQELVNRPTRRRALPGPRHPARTTQAPRPGADGRSTLSATAVPSAPAAVTDVPDRPV